MAGSQGRPFTLQHYYKILVTVQKWRLRDQETQPKKGDMLQLDDSDDENGGRNKGKPDRNKKAKERLKLEAEAENMSLKIDEMVKTKEIFMSKAMEARMIMANMKNAMKQARWEAIRQDDKRKTALEERRLELEEKAMMELIADKNRTMTMEPSTMDAFTREWWDMRREEILERRRQACFHASASGGGGRVLRRAMVVPVEMR
jgi:hypothetical protein